MAGNLRINHLVVESLVQYARNARTHSEAQMTERNGAGPSWGKIASRVGYACFDASHRRGFDATLRGPRRETRSTLGLQAEIDATLRNTQHFG